MKRIAAVIAVALAAVTTQSFAGTAGSGFLTGSCQLNGAFPGSSGTVLTVDGDGGGDYATIQEAVDAASDGDMIVIAPGIYTEHVEVTTPGLRIRGADRNTVILDGQSNLEYGINVEADRSILENMTGHNYTGTAFRWAHQTGYWGRYLTAYNNQGYGIYAFDARCGQMDNSFASGNADAGYYIGECYPCDAVITDVVATENALGYSGTNAGGNLVIRDSDWTDNALGIVPNSLIGEARPPQRGVTIKNNTIAGTNDGVPGVGFAGTYKGAGIAIAGGVSNQVYGNTITDMSDVGILITPLPETTLPPQLWIPSGNLVWGNTVSGSGIADIAQGAGSGPANCWSDNVVGSEAPPVLQTVWSCEASITPPGGDPRVELALIEQTVNERGKGDWKTWPAPALTFDQAPTTASQWLPALL